MAQLVRVAVSRPMLQWTRLHWSWWSPLGSNSSSETSRSASLASEHSGASCPAASSFWCLMSPKSPFCLMSRSEFVLVLHVPKRVISGASLPVQFCLVSQGHSELLWCSMSHTEFLLVPHVLGRFASILSNSHCWTCIIVYAPTSSLRVHRCSLIFLLLTGDRFCAHELLGGRHLHTHAYI